MISSGTRLKSPIITPPTVVFTEKGDGNKTIKISLPLTGAAGILES